MRVLLVAPRTDLLMADEEVEDVIRSGLTVTPLLGRVTATQLIREIKSGQFDALWFATHGSAGGIQLTDGLITAEELIPLARERFRLVVLNTCASLQVAQMIQEEAEVDVVCTISEVPDRQAYQTGSLFASALSKSPNVAAAYMRSKPGGNRLYLYLAALSPTQAILEPLIQEIRNLRKDVRRQNKHIVVLFGLNIVTAAAWLGQMFIWRTWG